MNTLNDEIRDIVNDFLKKAEEKGFSVIGIVGDNKGGAVFRQADMLHFLAMGRNLVDFINKDCDEIIKKSFDEWKERESDAGPSPV